MNKDNPVYKDPSRPLRERVEDLLSRMTLEEKIAQLQCYFQDVEGADLLKYHGIGNINHAPVDAKAGEVAEKYNRIQQMMRGKTRLGIPVLPHDEAVSGLKENGSTAFPQPLAQAATFNPELIGKMARAIAIETRSRGVRQVLSPDVNIVRDPRWGRTHETFGEDPYLSSRMGVAFCRAFEGEGVLTTPKHFPTDHGESGLNSDPVHHSERELREVYFPPFKACIMEGGASSIMPSYCSNDGIPSSANKWLLCKILREEWGFKGFTVSDYGSIGRLVRDHRTARDKKDAARQVLEAGLNVELPYPDYFDKPLLEGIKEGSIPEELIDQSARLVLEAKFKLGLFEDPFVDPVRAREVNDCKEHRELARQVARESIVLLKNKDNVLPLAGTIKSITVLGPLGNEVMLGNYAGWGMKTISVYEGIKNLFPSLNIFLEKGVELEGIALPAVPSECLIPDGGGGNLHGLKGEYFNNTELAGKPVLTRIDPVVYFDWMEKAPHAQVQPEHFSVRWTGRLIAPVTGSFKIGTTTDDGIRLYIDGKLLIDDWTGGFKLNKAVFILEQGRSYDIRMEYYKNLFRGVAKLGWDVNPGGDISRAVELAGRSDAAVIVAGVLDGEGKDRADLNLPLLQEQLIKEVAATGVPTIVVLATGNVITMKNWIDDVSAVIHAWYPGEEGGNAVAEVLFGKYNPAGRLPITIPVSVAQVPVYYNKKPNINGLPGYTNLTGEPQFPFGFGLSYTKFEYCRLQLSAEKIRAGDSVKVSVDVKNTGTREGEEVVQLYIRDVLASVARPLKELKGFRRISLRPGETKTVAFELTPEHLAMYDINMRWGVEPGVFEVMMGSSSKDIYERTVFEVVK
ncbi:MAG: glycoside hydrolase family 3 N-terminal domain-containing protein [Bacillota bacterium]